MKRVSEKVKDIVDVCPFAQINDFRADANVTVEAYKFTEITAGLMAKWIDAVAMVKPGQGQALALAGLRGVGKSHLLAFVAAISAHPELRVQIKDGHVSASAERLPRRSGKVFFVRRGSGESLMSELKATVSAVLDRPPAELSDSLDELLLTIFERGGETPLVLFDTAFDRDTRVARDDGPLLSQVAETARTMGLFVGVALDDDISGADGANSSIVTKFSIDYLDQEHLYKIVDNHIFTKRPQKLPLLHEIYEDYRKLVPGFRWSEQRFTALYPLHPETLELAPLIRLYIHDFALLGFAADTGVKILGRPANSLIGLDELFDSVEPRLRAATELEEVFAAYDGLEHEVIAKLPVKQRHIAKLALKGLFMLSLNGQGVSARDVAAAMMILPEDADAAGGLDAVFATFASALPDAIAASPEGKYSFRFGDKDNMRSVINEMAESVDDDAIWQVLLRQTAEKFSDLDIADNFGDEPTHCSLEWRGAIRRGEIMWKSDSGSQSTLDWRVRVVAHDNTAEPDEASQTFIWRVGQPTADDVGVLRRYCVLQNSADARERFGSAWSNATHVHSVAVEKVWQRLFIDDARLNGAFGEMEFTEETRSAHSISHLLSVTLSPSFEAGYPGHPVFGSILGAKQASFLIGGFFGGTAPDSPEAQAAAAAFALPLGLASRGEVGVVPVAAEQLLAHELLQPLLAAAASRGESVLALGDAARVLGSAPYGLTRESQQLVLAALVAQRQFDFVTGAGDRINHRSLDLQIIWDDIEGIALPSAQSYSSERLLVWARLITGNSSLASIDVPADRELINDSLTQWLDGWNNSAVLGDIDSLGDKDLNTRIWRLASSVRRSLGAMAEIIADPARDERRVDECLHRIAERFADSDGEFEARKAELRELARSLESAREQSFRRDYLAFADVTDDPEIESLRLRLLEDVVIPGDSEADVDGVWDAFLAAYSVRYGGAHARANDPDSDDEARAALASDAMDMFDAVADLPWFDQEHVTNIRDAVRLVRRPACDRRVDEILRNRPLCPCGFRLDGLVGEPPARRLRAALDAGLAAFGSTLVGDRERLGNLVPDSARLDKLIDRLADETSTVGAAQLSREEVHTLRDAAELLAAATISGASGAWPLATSTHELPTLS